MLPRTLLFSGLILGLFTLAAPAFAADDATVLARINGVEIKRSDVNKELAGLPPQLQQMPLEQIYPQLLERMIDSRLVVTEGYAAKLNESDDFKGRMKRAEERILADLTLREKIKPQLTDAKIKERYDSIVAKGKAEDEVKARHILVKTEKEAQDIIAELGKGGNFAKIAEAKSTDKGSAAKGGDLGYFSKTSMVPEFAKAAFDLKPGETTKTPVKTEFGYHVIKVEDRRKASPPPIDQVRPQVEAQLSDELANTYIDGLKKTAKIERFGLDGKPMADKKDEAKPDAKPATEAPKPVDAKPADKK